MYMHTIVSHFGRNVLLAAVSAPAVAICQQLLSRQICKVPTIYKSTEYIVITSVANEGMAFVVELLSSRFNSNEKLLKILKPLYRLKTVSAHTSNTCFKMMKLFYLSD